MLEALGINLLAGALSGAGSTGVGKIRNILRRDKFSQDIDDLTTEFTQALKQGLSDAVNDPTYEELQYVEVDWTTIAEELDELDAIFENEQKAVVQITDAVATGLDITLDTNPEHREKLESAVAEAYQTALCDFANRVAGTDLADVFDAEANIELTATVNDLDDRLSALQRRLRRYETASLRNIGITRLDPLYFERETPKDPKLAWRIGFDFADVQAGYPLDRQRPSQDEDGTREAITDEIIDRLDDSENLVVLGDGGSGKSTICKQVACQWYSDTERGPIFYRQSSTTATFDQPGDLEAAIRTADEQVLIIVEDAANDDAIAIFDVLDTFDNADDVSFLLDSRKNAWLDSDNLAGAPQFKRQRQNLAVVEVPALDEQECERALAHYKEATDGTVRRLGEQLYEEVRPADIGGPLVLAYELTGPPAKAGEGETATALHDDVHRAHIAVKDHAGDTDLPRIVAVMINILNAAELPVGEEFVHALATDRDDHRSIERTLGVLEGTMLEAADSGLGTPHQMWSVLYLEHVLENAGERVACDYFEHCVDTLFRLCDEDERREAVVEWLRTTPDIFKDIEEDPTGIAGYFVSHIADIGDDRATLGILFGTPETWSVQLPSLCPPGAKVNWYKSRGRTHLSRGALEAAKSEFNRLENLIDDKIFESVSKKREARALTLNNLGMLASSRGDLDSAEEHHKESLDINREIDDKHGQASSLLKLGAVLHRRNKLEIAEKYFEESLEIFHEVDDPSGQASIYNNLGLVAQDHGELETAENRFEKSLDLHRKIGDRRGQARNLTNLGSVAQERDELETAEKHNKESLAFFREVGNRSGEASSLSSLGSIAKERGELETAEEYYQESLKIFQEVGDPHPQASSLNSLGSIAKEHGELETAEEYYEECLEIGDRRHKAGSLTNLGNIAQERGELETAEEHYQESLEIFREVGDRNGQTTDLINLGKIAQERDELETAEEYYEECLEISSEVGNQRAKARSLNNLGKIAQERGELEKAKKYYEKEVTVRREIDHTHGEALCLTNLGVVAQERGNFDLARGYYEESVATFREIDSCICQLRALHNLGSLAQGRGELDAAKKHFENSLDISTDIDDSFQRILIIEDLIEVCEQAGWIEEALDWYNEGIEIAEEIENSEAVETFQTHRDSLTGE